MLLMKNPKGKNDTTNTAQGNKMQNNNNEISNIQEEKPQEELNINKKVHRVDSENEYYSIERNLKTYVLYSKIGNEKAINYLSNGPIFDRNIAAGQLNIKAMYAIDNENGSTYVMDIVLSENTYYIVLRTDEENATFKINEIEQEEYEKAIKGESSQYNNTIKISKNDYNNIEYVSLNNSQIAEKYLKSYVQNARYNPEAAYNSLDERYRNARFGNYRNFVEYLSEQNKAKQLRSLDSNSIRKQEEFSNDEEYKEYLDGLEQKGLERYDIFSENGKEYFICIDSYDNFYIFETNGVMNYKLYLDTYTVELGYFMKKNENSGIDDKIRREIEKVFEALNSKDYNYVYNKLEQSSKIGEYETYEKFVQYVNSNLFSNNEMIFEDSVDEDGAHGYKIIVTDKEGKNTRQVPITILLEIDENENSIVKSLIFGN